MDPITIALGLAQFAPSILKFFGVGDKPVAVAEQVVKIAQTVTGKGTPDEATAAMRADPALAQQFHLAVLAADTKLEELYLADKANARSRDIEVRKLDGGKNHRADIMLVAAFVAVIAIAALLALGQGRRGDGGRRVPADHRRHVRPQHRHGLRLRVRIEPRQQGQGRGDRPAHEVGVHFLGVRAGF
jgi:hypothetical protein